MKIIVISFLAMEAFGCAFCALGIVPISFRSRQARTLIYISMITTILALAWLSMTYGPAGSRADLYRSLERVERYQRFSYAELRDEIKENAVPMWPIISFVIGRIGEPVLLQGFCVVMTYFPLFITCACFTEKYKVPANVVCWYIIFAFCIGGYSNVWGNMRMPISWALSTLCIYFYCHYGLRWYIVAIEIFAITIHIAGFIPFMIYLLANVILRSRWTQVAFLFASFAASSMGTYLSESSNYYLKALGLKIVGYQADNIYRLGSRLIMAEIVLVLLLDFYVFFVLSKKMVGLPESMARFFSGYKCLLLFTTGCVANGQVFNRFVFILVYLSAPVFWLIYRGRRAKKKGVPLKVVLLLPSCAVLFAYNIKTFFSAYVPL